MSGSARPALLPLARSLLGRPGLCGAHLATEERFHSCVVAASRALVLDRGSADTLGSNVFVCERRSS